MTTASERLLNYELGKLAIQNVNVSENNFTMKEVESIGEQISGFVDESEVPSLLAVRSSLCEEDRSELVTFAEANEHRKELLLETVDDKRVKQIVDSFL